MKTRTSSRNAASSLERLSSTATLLLPLLAEGTYFQLRGPGTARLLVEQPIGFSDRRWRCPQVGIIERIRPQRLDPPLTHPLGVHAGVDNEMGDVNVLRSEFARRRLGYRTQAELGTGEGRIAGSAAQGRGRTGKEDIALAPRQHQAGCFATGKKAGIAGHFPDFSKHTLRGLDDREVDVGAKVEHADLERRMLVG